MALEAILHVHNSVTQGFSIRNQFLHGKGLKPQLSKQMPSGTSVKATCRSYLLWFCLLAHKDAAACSCEGKQGFVRAFSPSIKNNRASLDK